MFNYHEPFREITGLVFHLILPMRSVMAVWTLFLISCVHVVAIFWVRVSRRLDMEEACFRMRITLGVVFIRSLVYTKCVPGRLRSGYGVALN